MTKGKTETKLKPTGTAAPAQQPTDKPSDPAQKNRVQVHPGNVPVVTVQMLSSINYNLERIANALEKANGGSK
jgi:hypothetical protein